MPNQGQKIADIPEIEELLEQEGLKGVVRTLRELTATENSLGQRAKIALERLTPLANPSRKTNLARSKCPKRNRLIRRANLRAAAKTLQ